MKILFTRNVNLPFLIQTIKKIIVNTKMSIGQISNRELEVLQLVSLELTSKEIANRLYISNNTAETHRKHIKEKLDARNAAGMVRRGFELGLLKLKT